MKKLLACSLLSIACIPAAHATNVSLFANYLGWRAHEDTSAIWSSEISVASANQLVFAPKNIQFDWNHGFRLGANIEPNHFFDTKAYWTHYNTTSRVSHSADTQIILPEFFSGFLSGNLFFSAGLDWDFTYNTFDLEASHAFKPSESFSIRPAIGVKAGTIEQTVDANWDAVVYISTENVSHKYYGVGPSFALNAKWNAYDQLNVIGNLSTAFMFGKWNVKDVYKRPSALGGLVTPTTITTSFDEQQLGTFVFDYLIGLEWVTKSNPKVTLQLGYELQYWANQLRLPTFQQLPLHGDLTLEGATCGIYIDL